MFKVRIGLLIMKNWEKAHRTQIILHKSKKLKRILMKKSKQSRIRIHYNHNKDNVANPIITLQVIYCYHKTMQIRKWLTRVDRDEQV